MKKTEFEKLLFYSDGMSISEIKENLKKLIVQKQRWFGGFHPDSKIRREAFLSSGINIGKDVFFSVGTVILDDYKKIVTIGDRVAFGNNVSLIAASGPNNSLLSNIEMVKEKYIKTLPISIGCDVWIGTGVLVLPGVSIGEKSIIGAGAVITKDVEPYSVIAGIPGRIINKIDNNIDINRAG